MAAGGGDEMMGVSVEEGLVLGVGLGLLSRNEISTLSSQSLNNTQIHRLTTSVE